ncbi:hypothetical protein BH23BAC4_BH23BAC4_09240 [soil metagenome]
METTFSSLQNPLDGLLSDELFAVLHDNQLLSTKGIRDFQMRERFRQLRQEHVPAADAIEELRIDFPYLQFDTIRKIVYGLSRRA